MKLPLTKSQEKAIGSYRARIAEHKQKLADYIADPDAFDNKGHLANAPSQEVRDKIIAGRVKHLEQEIKTFEDNIDKVYEEAAGVGP